MRLIDADAIPELFDKEYKATRLLIEQGEEYLDNLAAGFTEAHHVIQRIPTIEAEPVKHGRWMPQDVRHARFWFCSECQTNGSPVWKRCPVCEAKMDG